MRSDLVLWVRRRKAGGRASMSYQHVSRMGIYRLHRGDELQKAQKYLERILDSYGLKDDARRNAANLNLELYAEWLRTSGVISIATKATLGVPITQDVIVGGQVPRVDLLIDADRYRAILLGATSASWKSELRMPLIQRGVALTLDRPEHLVTVGVQNVDGSGMAETSYSKRAIDEAVRELAELAEEAQRALK